jgi:tetratricopeptide (TPR) repeat protein
MSIAGRIITLSLVTLVTGITSVAQAQSVPASTTQVKPVELLNRGQQKARRGNYKGAIADYTLALQSNPKLTDAYIYRGLAHHDLGDYRQAIADFDQAARI